MGLLNLCNLFAGFRSACRNRKAATSDETGFVISCGRPFRHSLGQKRPIGVAAQIVVKPRAVR
jgi:hypothetical protein